MLCVTMAWKKCHKLMVMALFCFSIKCMSKFTQFTGAREDGWWKCLRFFDVFQLSFPIK